MTTLQDYLNGWARGDAEREAVAATIAALAGVANRLSSLLADGAFEATVSAAAGVRTQGDCHHALNRWANTLFREGLREAPVFALASEVDAAPVMLSAAAPIAVTIEPLDGSNNFQINAPIASVFAMLSRTAAASDEPHAVFRQPGERQLAAGFVLFGPQTSLVLTVREGVQVYALDRDRGEFRLTENAVRVPEGRCEYSINASNQRHWDGPVRAFVEDCVAGVDGPRGADFSMRWLDCVAAEVFRILRRGGVFLDPGDARPEYQKGRLRLLWEANPLALLVEQAGGAATNGFNRVLALVPQDLHQRVPLVLGARDEVQRITSHHIAGVPQTSRSPLFGERGLFR